MSLYRTLHILARMYQNINAKKIFFFYFCTNLLFSVLAEDKVAIFKFPEFDYKETSKNELSYREAELSCEQNSYCENLIGLEKMKCTRKCISSSCYKDIYQFDELEHGEIDVRLNSFKGCFIQRNRL